MQTSRLDDGYGYGDHSDYDYRDYGYGNKVSLPREEMRAVYPSESQ